jgi:hypothetical protein
MIKDQQPIIEELTWKQAEPYAKKRLSHFI